MTTCGGGDPHATNSCWTTIRDGGDMLTRSEGRCHSLTGCADRSKRGGIRDGNSARHAVNSDRDGSDGFTRRGYRPHDAVGVGHSYIRGGRIDEGRGGRHRHIRSGVSQRGRPTGPRRAQEGQLCAAFRNLGHQHIDTRVRTVCIVILPDPHQVSWCVADHIHIWARDRRDRRGGTCGINEAFSTA